MSSPKSVTINFDSNISKVVYLGNGDFTWTTSGETLNGFDWSSSFEVTLNAGYVIDSITTNDVTTVESQTDTTFKIEDMFTTTAIITITSKQSTPQPTLTFKHFYDAGTIGSGTVKFRHYSQQEPSTGETWVLNENLTSQSFGIADVSFSSNGSDYIKFARYYKTDMLGEVEQDYVAFYTSDTNYVEVYGNGTWTNTAYRTLTFATAPTGDLLTWLQANGVKQGGQVTLIDFTIDDSPTTGQVQYQAEEGMTWQQFVYRSYNTNNSVTISTYDNYVRYKGRQISDVTKDNVIIANKIYKTNTGSSGGGID